MLGGAAGALLCAVLLAGQGFGPAVQAQTPTVDYDADGDGLIEVATVAQLNAIRWDLNGDGAVDNSANATDYAAAFPNALTSPRMGCASGCDGYELNASLDLSSAGHSTLGWAPIGDNSTDTDASRFTATFDGGAAFTISNLFINRVSTYNIGLFGRTGSTSLIRNVTLEDVTVAGFGQVGALVGWNTGSISGSSASGTVTASGNFAGGLVGLNYGTISTSSAAVATTGVNSVGGLVGSNYDAGADGDNSISDSSASGDVIASGNFAGGLVGWNNGPISNSRASGDATGVNSVGGLVGNNYDAQTDGDNAIGTSAASGVVTASGDFAGGLVGWNNGPISNSRASANVTGVNAVGGLVGSNYDEQSDGDNPISESAASGTVRASGSNAGGLVGWNNGPISDSSARGYVEGYGPVGGLVGRSDGSLGVNATRRSTASGDVAGNSVDGAATGGLIGWNDGPISDSFASGDVKGHDQVGGLVGYSSGVIADSSAIGAVGGSTNTGDRIGGLAGESRREVRGSTAFGNVESTGTAVGGLVGHMSGRIIESAASGAVTGGASTGGLVGNKAAAGAVTGSTASGTVSGTMGVGGLVGNSQGEIVRSYATGQVTGTNQVGGLVGDLTGSIFASYATGMVTGSEAIGGLVGRGRYGGIRASYATGAVTGTSSVGGLAGSLSSFSRGYYSYWDTVTTGRSVGIGSDDLNDDGQIGSGEAATHGASGLTTSALQAPTGYAGVYLHWNVEHVSTDFGFEVIGAKDPWDFGTVADYPRLRRPSDPPSFSSTTASSAVGEDAALGTDLGSPVTASHTNLDALVYALVGADAFAFDIDSGTGQLRVGAAFNYEAQSVFTFAVQVTNGKLVAFRHVEITVTDVDEPPVFGSAAATREVPEHTPAATAIGPPIAAVDPEGDSLSYSLAGPDAALFAISSDGQLRTSAALDYEFLRSHHVTVRASDGSNAALIDVTVNVVNRDDPGRLRLSSLQPQVGAALTAAVVDQDGNATGITWVWEGSTDGSAWTPISGATSAGYTPVAGDVNNYLRVTASYSDPLGAGRSAQLEIDRAVRVAPVTTNVAPAFPSTETGARSVAENTAGGRDIGAPVAATDADSGDTLTYALSGSGAEAFDIDAASGQLRTKSALDADRQSSYAVTVTATDPSLASTSQAVTITITPVDEAPSLSGTAEIELAENHSGAVGRYTASDPESGTITWSLAGEDAAAFVIASGTLSFAMTPDFEAPADTGRDNVYHVSVQASDGANSGTRTVRVTVTDVDEGPVVTGPSTVTHAENTPGAVAAFSADDPENAPISWSLAGTDRLDFSIGATGVLRRRFLQLRNYEFPADSGSNNTYEVTVQASDGTHNSTHAVTITVTDTEEMPLVTGEAEVEFAENGSGDVATYQADDPEGTTVTWLELAGADKDLFEFSDSGVLSFKQPPDFESPMDADTLNTYDLTVSAMDQAMLTGAWDLTVVVTDVNEPPVLSGDSAPSHPESAPALIVSVAEYTAEDADAGDSVFGWAVTGVDNEDFEISSDGVLRFLAVPDFESPHDANGDSIYNVTVQVSDLEHTTPLPVTVTITNENEPGSVLLSSQQAQGNVPLVSELSDPDGGMANQMWTWWRSPNQTGPWTQIDGATSATYTPTSADADHYLQVRVSYTDRAGGSEQRAAEAIALPWSAGPPEDNVPPEFPSSETGARDVDENTRNGEHIGNRIEATDQNDPFLTYQLDDANARFFDIERDTGQLLTKVALDRESRSEYRGSVTVNDSYGASAMISVTITVNDVNEPPLVSGESIVVFTEHVPDPVATYTATDPEDNAIEWEVGGPDANAFSINAAGELSFLNPPFTPPEVDPGFECQFDNWVPVPDYDNPIDSDADNVYELNVSATDSANITSEDFGVIVRVTDAGPIEVCPTTGVPTSTFTGGGGGGGGPSGPPPSDIDFEWTVKHDIEALAAGHDRATGMWSDGVTLWLAHNGDGAADAIYAYDLGSGERVAEREFDLDEANRAPRGVWSDGLTIWIADSGRDRLFGHDLATGERLAEQDVALADDNGDPRGIWSDGETLWVLDGRDDALFAYEFEGGELLAGYALASANGDPRGLFFDGVTFWVSDHGAKRLFAYRLDAGEDGALALERNRDEEFPNTVLSRASNNSPRGIWSDGDVMYVADASDEKVYSYNMPDAIDARLASLSLSGIEIGEFSARETEYTGVAAEGVAETTVEAAAVQSGAGVAIDPPDADEEADGHQVALAGVEEITLTVSSADASRTKLYRVRFAAAAWDPLRDPWPHCLRGAVSEGFSLVVFAGGSVDELVTCAESRDITALYALHEGVYVPYILGAPDFVNRDFSELFAGGLPVMAPLVAGSDGPPSADPFGDDLVDAEPQPWPECLRGAVVEGFGLGVYAGGSVEELVACAESGQVTALYALHGGEFVSYILGAPEFVNQPFQELYPDGLPPLTPLVARSEGSAAAN